MRADAEPMWLVRQATSALDIRNSNLFVGDVLVQLPVLCFLLFAFLVVSWN